MTLGKFVGFGILLSAITSAVKIYFYGSLNWADSPGLHYAFWIIISVVAIALVRRLGVISFLEVIVVSGVWLLFCLLTDLLVTAMAVGARIFIDPIFLMGYLLMVVVMFLFHKKRHVHIRRERKAAK